MPGGRLHLSSCCPTDDTIHVVGLENTRFKSKWKKHVCYGAQKHRIDPQHTHPVFNYETHSEFTFSIPPNDADLLLNTYVIISLPHIWSPVRLTVDGWKPYEFRWIESIGTSIIEDIEIFIGSTRVQRFTGTYMKSLMEREYPMEKYNHNRISIGVSWELFNPSLYGGYAHAWAGSRPTENTGLPYQTEPTITGRRLCIPVMAWYHHHEHQAVPLRSMKYEKLRINIRFRPVKQWFTTLDTSTPQKRVSPDGITSHDLTRFIREPPVDAGGDPVTDFEAFVLGNPDYYETSISTTTSAWNPDLHLIGTYAYIDEQESRAFQTQPQMYLYRDIVQQEFRDIVSNDTLEITEKGCIHSITIKMQRDDIHLRNEWNNYSNWEWNDIHPNAPSSATGDLAVHTASGNATGYLATPSYLLTNERRILLNVGIICDGVIREESHPVDVSNFIELQKCPQGCFPRYDGYYHSFGLSTTLDAVNPTGSFNASHFRRFELAVTVTPPPRAEGAIQEITCVEGFVVGVNDTNIHKYTYRAIVMLECYNVLQFKDGYVTKLFMNRR